MIWLVIASSNTCRIYTYIKKEKKITLINEFIHPEAKLKSSELVSDKPGHYKTDGSSHGAYVPREEPKEIEIVNFAREIGNTLKLGRKKSQFEHLILVALPHMYGLIHQHLAGLKGYTFEAIHKNYCFIPEHQLLKTLKRDLEKATA